MRDYDLAVVGDGAGGLTSAGVGASLGISVVLLESKKLGGMMKRGFKMNARNAVK